MKMSLLDIVQSVLSDMNSDDVNSISDTIEAEQVAMVVRDTYYEMIVSRKLLDLKNYFQLESLNDASTPNFMRLPNNVSELIEVRYKGEVVKNVSREEFMRILEGRADNTAVEQISEPSTGLKLSITNNFKPMCWTSFDDTNIVFDAWEKDLSQTLLTEDVIGYGEIMPVWSMTDGFVPQLPLKLYPLLLAEVKSKAFADIKQMASAKEEQKATRLRQYMSRERNRTFNGIRYPNYGRKKGSLDYGRRY